MVIDSIKELEAAKAKVAALEEKIAEELFKSLAALPAEFGFESMDDFIEALRAAGGARRGRKPGKKVKAAKSAKSAGKPTKSGKKRAKRSKITAETKESVRSLVAAGKTGSAIAKELGISLPSVQNIKRELGLVKKR